MNVSLDMPYHEAAHVLAGWVLDLPIDRVVIDKNGWGVKKSRWYNMTRQFREVSQETVRKDVIFCLSGDYGEMLVGAEGPHLYAHDDYVARFLSRKFALNLSSMREDAFSLVLTNKRAISKVAQKLVKKAESAKREGKEALVLLNPYEMTLERMNWLARGKC